MRAKGVVWIAAATLAAHSASGEAAVAWGAAFNGMRLGISFESTPPGTGLRVSLQNVGPAMLDVLIGRQVGTEISVNFKFIATCPDGKRHEGFDVHTFTPIAGLTVPAVVKLEPGNTHDLHYSLKKILCVEKPGDLTFETMVKRRCSVHVSLETDKNDAKRAGLSHPWIGKVASAELAPPN